MSHMSALLSTWNGAHNSELCQASAKTIDKNRFLSDELLADASTAAPSPEASPILGRSPSPLSFPGELLLVELDALEEHKSGSWSFEEYCEADEAKFQMIGFEEGNEHFSTICEAPRHQSFVVVAVSDDIEDVEGELLDLLTELKALRAETQEDMQVPERRFQKLPYPQLESGFLPTELMLTKSWLTHSGHAETGQWASAMAPRPCRADMEPLNICLGEHGARLEVAQRSPEKNRPHGEQKHQRESKEIFRRRRGRSRSPTMRISIGFQSSCVRGRSR